MVTVHLNLRRGDWVVSVKRRVVGYRDTIALHNVSFKISEARRIAVVKQHCREVHAWCVGTVSEAPSLEGAIEITYNPFRCGAFTRRDNGAELTGAEYVIFLPGKRAVAINPY